MTWEELPLQEIGLTNRGWYPTAVGDETFSARVIDCGRIGYGIRLRGPLYCGVSMSARVSFGRWMITR
ncbi:protein of unknown function [Nitrospira japonica]|uniref:Uncharacterized protein n=1 Tax=Nitrospira japonica TaxID=1325564 RepID=A0A1W1I9M3_9BACT|nr:protein of unknown function [Nitrospira japonica]